MQIFKYFLLLLLLAFIGISVYIATQKGDFNAVSSKVISVPKSTVYDYINDYKNWESFGSWNNDEDIAYSYSQKTMGNGGSFSWKMNNNDGFMKTIYTKDGDSIAQKLIYDSSKSDVYWKFKDTIGGTKVTWRSKGELGFLSKIYSFLNGGSNKVIGNMLDKSLFNLDKTLKYELKTYSIKANTVTQRKASYHIMQTVTCNSSSVTKNIKIIFTKLNYFFKKNGIPMAGKPYVIYGNTNYENDVVTISVCAPTRNLVHIMEGSDLQSGQIDAFTCLKTTLTGDYSHLKEAWKKAEKHIVDNGFKHNFGGKYSETYVKTIDDIKKPSKWITEIYIPVFPKDVPLVSPIVSRPTSRIATPTAVQPEPTSITPATTEPVENP